MAVPHVAAPERLNGRRGLALAAVVVALGACSDLPGGLSDGAYVEAMAQLTWARIQYADTPRDDSARAAVLDDLGISGQELLDFVDLHGGDVVRMDRLWEEVGARVQELSGAPVPENLRGEAQAPEPGER